MRSAILLVAIGCSASSAFAAVPSPFRSEPPLKEEELITALIDSLGDADQEVRQNIAIALANMGQRAVPRLIEALADDTMQRRAGAAYALGQVRPAPKTAIPGLLKAMKDEHELVRRQVSYALSRIVGRDPANVPPGTSPAPPLDPAPSAASGGPR